MFTKFHKPILVTGATGTVGSRCVPWLIAQGEQVRALVRDPESDKARALRAAGAELAVGDLTAMSGAQLKEAVDGTAAVVHLAAAFRGGEGPEESAAINTKAAEDLARAALDTGVSRFVFASTNLVYGDGHAYKQDEEAEFRPLGWPSPYPLSKREAEAALDELRREHGLDLRTVRLAFVYGDGDPHIEEFLGRSLTWHPAKRLQMVHHADVAQGLTLALRAEGIAGEAFNIADDAAVTYAELLHYLGRPVTEEMLGRELTDPWFGMADTTKARRVLGFRPVYPTVYQAIDAGTM